jgi:hypothetical protein
MHHYGDFAVRKPRPAPFGEVKKGKTTLMTLRNYLHSSLIVFSPTSIIL